MINKLHRQINWTVILNYRNRVYGILILLLLSVSEISAQSKGVIQINRAAELKPTNTFAVIVGISDYQNSQIPDLKYADRDALSFAHYLQSAAAGKIKEQHIRLLLNEQATMAHFAVALDWLWEVCKPGDQVIIYFSGHGDVERRSITQPGFLLCWDSPANVYMSGGAFSLYMLQEIISTLSLKNQTQTIAIIDACRSGKLAGSTINGSQLTNLNLAKQYANEIKILSCQPDEYSIEGEQWGGGRGAFSYHLINGLCGLADENEDLEISSYELGRYLEDHVKKDVAPIRQIPMLMGSKDYTLSKVFKNIVDSINSNNSNNLVLFSGIDSRSIDYLVEANSDTALYNTYKNFNKCLKAKTFLLPEKNCADYYYLQLLNSEKLKSLHSTLTRNYAAALQDEAQQFINNILQSDIVELTLSKKIRIEKSRLNRTYLERSIQLLGNKHYLYPSLVSRIYYFKAFELLYHSNNPNAQLGSQINDYLRNALSYQSEMPLYYYSLGLNYSLHLKNLDSCIYYFNNSIRLAPSWMLPKIILPTVLYTYFNKDSISLVYFSEVMNKLSNEAPFLNGLGLFYSTRKNYKEAEFYLSKAHLIDSAYVDPLDNLSCLYYGLGNYKEALVWAEKALNKDSLRVQTLYNLGNIYYKLKQFLTSEQFYLKALQ